MKKNERISVITKILSDHPNEVFSYNYFTDLLDAGKSSVCEDVAIVKNAIELTGTGYVETGIVNNSSVKTRKEFSKPL